MAKEQASKKKSKKGKKLPEGVDPKDCK